MGFRISGGGLLKYPYRTMKIFQYFMQREWYEDQFV
jgi:hypothetical protein